VPGLLHADGQIIGKLALCASVVRPNLVAP
jgi:hypothetical protein